MALHWLQSIRFSDFLNVRSLIGSALGATIFGWLGAYFAVKGKNVATRQDLDVIKTQLRETTEIVQAVDLKFTQSDVLWRAELSFRQQQLAELYGPIYGLINTQQEIYGLWIEGLLTEKKPGS